MWDAHGFLSPRLTSSPLSRHTGERERCCCCPPPGSERREISSPVSALAQLPGVACPPASRLLLARLAFSTRYCSRLPARALHTHTQVGEAAFYYGYAPLTLSPNLYIYNYKA